MNILQKFKALTTLIFDMDGVLTDGSLLIMPGGEWLRQMNIKDGYALQLAVKHGYRVIVITGSSSIPVEQRLYKLGIKEVFQQVKEKKVLAEKLMREHHLSIEEVMYMGDDVPDLELIKYVGVSCCPVDAARDILEVADYISPVKGGKGCVRDVIERILRVQGKWKALPDIAST
jgi:3-deoxy-D-manno-octulosonate 8-phosphate phosphatase (KDO 8-P phosphatase)